MTFDIFCKNSKDAKIIEQKFRQAFTKLGHIYKQIAPDYCVVIGGDGAVLRAVDKHFNSLDKTKFITLHYGTLGFFADFSVQDIDKILNLLDNKEYELKNSPLLKLDITSKKGKVSSLYAFNEFTIQSFVQSLIADVYVDEHHLENFRGTGFCISTPSGSTAYNKALGGAIIYRDLDVFELTEMASINHNKYHSLGASLVLGRNHKVTIKPAPQSSISMTADFKAWIEKEHWLMDEDDDIETMECYLSEKNAIFVLPLDASFIGRLKRSFII